MDEYDFLGDVAVAGSVDSFDRAITPFLSQAFHAKSLLAIHFHRTRLPKVLFRWIPDKTLRQLFDKRYEKLGFMVDPFFHRAFLVQDWEACLLRDIAPDRFESSEYFTNYFGDTNMVDELGFVARIDNDTAVHLSMGRNQGQRRFRTNDVVRFGQFAKILAPKLRQILINQPADDVVEAQPLDRRFHAMAQARHTNISIREAEVAALIVQGHSSRAIGLKLGISGLTVKVHRRTLYKKLSISSQNELFGLLVNYVGADA
ncbi:helix-turn-helix transcriptional regulator [Ruegeria sp. SCPT10]|uniref:helix-turn-helix transcriptional regulator n=1 Tax=Ruegeria sp. SCP10 TaxID=3141377 RepID=UPI003335B6A3